MDILMIVMMRQGCQDIGRYIGKLCRVICDDASRSRSKSTLGDSDGIDMVMPQGDQGARWPLITRFLTTLSKIMIISGWIAHCGGGPSTSGCCARSSWPKGL